MTLVEGKGCEDTRDRASLTLVSSVSPLVSSASRVFCQEHMCSRNTSDLVQPRSRIVQRTPVLDSPARIPKNTPDRLASPRAADPFSLPTRKGNSQPPNAFTLFGLRRGNMAAPADIYNSPSTGSHGLRTPPTSSLTVSPSLCTVQLSCPVKTLR